MHYPALDLRFPSATQILIDRVTARLDDFSPTAIHETGPEDAPIWRVFFANGRRRRAAAAALTREYAAGGLRVTPIDVPDDDWAARSQSSLRAIRIGRLIVAPPWDLPRDPGDALVIVVRPSTGFGTGHHETTRLCLDMLQHGAVAGRRVLDGGTGSGVLAVAAARLGAARVRGIDIDPDALRSAAETLALNGVAGVVEIAQADISEVEWPADLVIANLTGTLLMRRARALLANTADGGQLVLSGFERHEAAEVAATFGDATRTERTAFEGEWGALMLTKVG